MSAPPAWPFWVVSREPREARATLLLCAVAFGTIAAATVSTGTSGLWFEVSLAVGFLVWALAQWLCVEGRRRRELAFRRDVEQYLRALDPSAHGE